MKVIWYTNPKLGKLRYDHILIIIKYYAISVLLSKKHEKISYIVVYDIQLEDMYLWSDY